MKAAWLTKKLKDRVLATVLAGAVGAFVMTPAVYALPVNPTHDAAVTIAKSNNNLDMNISSTAANNVIKWQDFSIARGEKVAFDAKNYLNQVTGSKVSEIWGTLKGGGTIYLINPNGIVFGAGSQVNVGALYASTRALSDADIENFKAGNALSALANVSLTGDIVNMGDLTATKKITLEGNNLIFSETDIGKSDLLALANNSTVNLVVAQGGSVKLGTLSGDDANGYIVWETQHQSDAMDKTRSFQLVKNKTELQNISNNLEGNYLLVQDIEAGEFEPISSGFKGQFNGMYYEIKGLKIEKPEEDSVGLFKIISADGVVKNVGLVGSQIKGHNHVGGIAGQNSGTISNVYNTGDIEGSGDGTYLGGIVGYNNGGTISCAYNTGNMKGPNEIAGIAGRSNGTIENVYNTGNVTGTGNIGKYGGIVGLQNSTGTLRNAYNTGDVSGKYTVGGIVGKNSRNNNTGDIGLVSNVYNTGAVGGTTNVNVFVGVNDGTLEGTHTTIENVDTDIWDTSGTMPTLKRFVKPVTPAILWSGKFLRPQPATNPTPTPTPAAENAPTPKDQPITQTATTSLDLVLKAAGVGEIKEAASITMKALTEAENSAAPNVQTTDSSVRPQGTVDSQEDMNLSFIGDGMLTMVNEGVTPPVSMSAGEVAAQQNGAQSTAPARNENAMAGDGNFAADNTEAEAADNQE